MNTSHIRYGWIKDVFDLAQETGYPYFVWNDRVYESKEAKFVNYVYDRTSDTFVEYQS
jgi:hypothetical protein